MPAQSELTLIRKLTDELGAAQVAYCHWKSNDALDRSASGENDLDLLIKRTHASRFNEIVGKLGFKRVEAPKEKWMPGVMDFYGFDVESEIIVHLHVHYQLVLGHDMTKNYRLPVEGFYLDSVSQDGLFPIPSVDFEYIVLVLRLVLKHCTWDSMLIRSGIVQAAERSELELLQSQIERPRMEGILRDRFPYVDTDLFHRCEVAIEPRSSIWSRVRAGADVQTALRSGGRRRHPVDVFLKAGRWLKLGLERRILGHVPRRRLATGGSIVAIVGGDGAGKTTIVDPLYSWLSKEFEVAKIHLGKPPWSRLTYVVRGVLAIGRRLGLYPHINSSILYSYDGSASRFRGKYPWMFREVCRARDRYLAYSKAAKIVTNGGIVISDRYPLPQVTLMDSPYISKVLSRADRIGVLSRLLVKREEKYYVPIRRPEILIVLRVDPDVAVQRKTDEDPTEVRLRSTEIWEMDWGSTQVHIIDGQQPASEVLSRLKSLIWAEL